MLRFIICRFAVICVAMILDFFVGDPYWFPHPVKFMGKLISILEKLFRRVCHSAISLKLAGILITILTCFVSGAFTIIILKVLKAYLPFSIMIEIIICTTCIAARSLDYEASKTLKALSQSLDAGRKQLSNIVGRDTACLSEEEVFKACIETVAENISDGVIAPIFYMFFFGATGGIVYKQINTLDSMIGYKNERYKDIGFFAAKLDDIVNFIPSRLSAFLLLVSARFSTKSFSTADIKRGYDIFIRDRFNHLSPNSAQTESVIAGLLGIQLGGTHTYFGKTVVKKTIGDKIKPASASDVRKTIKLIYKSEIVFFILGALLFGVSTFFIVNFF